LVKDIQKAIVDKMSACESDPAPGECVAMLVRALRNAGLPETIPVLLGLAETSKDGGVSEAAIKALSRMGEDNLRRDEVGAPVR
jgi:HEAT repeat protein